MCEESSKAEYTKEMCTAVAVPLRDKIAEFKIARLFMAKFYKVSTTTVTVQDEPLTLTAISVTGTALNLTWKNFMPTHWLKKVQPLCAKMRAASATTFTVEDFVRI